MYSQAAILEHQRLSDDGVVRREVVRGEHATRRFERGDEKLTQLAAIEDLGAMVRDQPQGAREIWLREHLAGARWSAAGQKRGGAARIRGQDVAMRGNGGGEQVADGEALLRIPHRRIERAGEIERAVPGQQLGPRRENAGYGHQLRASLGKTIGKAIRSHSLR